MKKRGNQSNKTGMERRGGAGIVLGIINCDTGIMGKLRRKQEVREENH